MSKRTPSGLAALPSMTVLLKAATESESLRDRPHAVIRAALREVLDDLRREIQSGAARNGLDIDNILQRAQAVIDRRRADRLVPVINATGIVLHTGLGRSVLADEAVAHITDTARGYCNLEFELATNQRGRRGQYAEQLLCDLTGAQAALIVNNNAAATMLVLHELAHGHEVIVSRGQLIEIGGAYRLPDVMAAGGAVLREVGTTNKTRLEDYERAIGPQTALIMHVHTSNYRMVGFTHMPTSAELVQLAHNHDLPMFDDIGSGALLDDAIWAAADEPTVMTSLRQGADVVAFSGDKLLGGPQAGILLGSRAMIDRLRGSPMARALRIDKLTIAALEATLELYHSPEKARQRIPLLAALSASMDALSARAQRLAATLRAVIPTGALSVTEEKSYAGGGSMPAWPMPTAVVRWQPPQGTSCDDVAYRLRTGSPAVLVRIRDGAVLLDMRTVTDAQCDPIVRAMTAAAKLNQHVI